MISGRFKVKGLEEGIRTSGSIKWVVAQDAALVMWVKAVIDLRVQWLFPQS